MNAGKYSTHRVTFPVSRRQFIALSTAATGGLSMSEASSETNTAALGNTKLNEATLSVIGPYGNWAAARMESRLPEFSYRRKEWKDIETWRKAARQRLGERLVIPDLGGIPKVTVKNQYSYDNLQVEELSWQLPYGRPTDAILLKPLNAKGKLPGILAFHDHGGNKYFGTRKITRTADKRHPLMEAHQKEYYSDRAWANEIARRGYVVLVSDAFPFASRRVMMRDIPEHLRAGLTDENPEDPNNIDATINGRRNMNR